MVKKPKKSDKSLESMDEEKDSKKEDLSEKFLDTIKWSITDFDKISEEERTRLYGNSKFLDQFWNYFKTKHPTLLDKIDKDDLRIYFETIEKSWFPINKIKNDQKYVEGLHEEIKPEWNEKHVMEDSLSNLKTFCENKINKMPSWVWEDFSKEAWFDKNSCKIDRNGKLKTIDDLWVCRKQYTETKSIKTSWDGDNNDLRLKDYHMESIEKILNPNYNPTERIIVGIAVKKIWNELKWKLKKDFEDRFGKEVNIFSDIQDLVSFQNERINFLEDHKSEIDANLIKKLDDIIVTNRDIQKQLLKSGRKFDDSKWFSEWENYFRRIYNKITPRQLFDDIKSTKNLIDTGLVNARATFKEFSPYVNEIFKIYPYNDKDISNIDGNLHSKIQSLDKEISNLESKIINADGKEKKKIRAEVKKIKQEQELLKWQAYIKYLGAKDKKLAEVIDKLVNSKFDFNWLDKIDQQYIVDFLVKNKLQDMIKNKIPEILSVDEEDLKKFVNDFFDLNKMELKFPTKDGPVNVLFKEKRFLWEWMKKLLSVNEMDKEFKNLPLNFKIDVNWSSEDFFEKNMIFDSLFYDFWAKDWPKRINDAYKVRLKKDWKIVEWYLSAYSPIWYEGKEDETTQALFLYSQPITEATQYRELVKRPSDNDKGKWDYVAIPKGKESEYDLEILKKEINLNGEAVWAMLFGFVLGQQSMNKKMSQQEEDELVKKLWMLSVYKDKNENYPEEEQEELDEQEESKEQKETGYELFLKEWDKLNGYKFPKNAKEKIDNKWFRKWSTLFIKYGETCLPPAETWWSNRIQMKIVDISPDKTRFKIKITWWEMELNDCEWVEKWLPINGDIIGKIKDAFGEDIYKLPDTKWSSLANQLEHLRNSWFDQEFLDGSFGNLKIDWNKIQFALWDSVWEEVKYFGFDEKKYEYDEKNNKTVEKPISILYKIKHNSNGTINVSTDTRFKDKKWEFKYDRDMDYNNFLLFVASKKLQPKTNEKAMEDKKIKADKEEKLMEKKWRRFSINNIIWFFKNSKSKFVDNLKKRTDERTDDLTDILVKDWKVFEKMWWMFGPFRRIWEAFETMWAEYYMERDARVWKKIEKWQKLYEWDPHFASYYNDTFSGMLKRNVIPKDIYKIPAMLLAMINSGKWPYNRNSGLVGKWYWINVLLWKKHQKRYTDIVNEKMKELKQNASMYGSERTSQRTDELIKLEMKYIVDCIDGREHSSWWPEEKFLASKWSRKFATTLDDTYQKFYNQNTIKEWFDKIPSTTNFEFARYEYDRFIRSNRPQQAIPFLKVMAQRAVSSNQFQILQMYVISWILSWLFLNTILSDTKWFIKDILRTAGFIPWLWTKDINAQTKMLKLLNIFSAKDPKWNFEKSARYRVGEVEKKYNLSNFSLGNLWDAGAFNDINSGLSLRWSKDNNGEKFCKFLELTWGKSINGEDLITLSQDPKLSPDDRALLQEYIILWNEKDEDIDPDIKMNPNAVSRSPFTKCETVVRSLMKYSESEFEWKNSNEKMWPKFFWNEVSRQMPRWKMASSAQIEFYLKKFLNRFGGLGFDGNNRTMFIRRLLIAQRELKKGKSREVEDLLRYSINGTILSNNGWSKWLPPEEFKNGLDAFKNFFKNNLDTILDKEMINKTMWKFYEKDLDVKSELGDRWEYVKVSDPSLSFGVPPDERKENSEKRKKYKSADFLNEKLYELAKSLDRSNIEQNRFRDYFKSNNNQKTNNTRSDLSYALSPKWARIKNVDPNLKENIKNTLEWKSNDDDNTTERNNDDEDAMINYSNAA